MEPTWDATMETGDPVIDRQHREIIRLVDDLDAAQRIRGDGDGELYSVLTRVMDFTIAHFNMEEDLMDRVGYPPDPAREMIEQHHEFTAYARLRVLEFRSGESESIHGLQSFLREWLVGHEFGLDRKLVRWIQEHRAGDRGGREP